MRGALRMQEQTCASPTPSASTRSIKGLGKGTATQPFCPPNDSQHRDDTSISASVVEGTECVYFLFDQRIGGGGLGLVGWGWGGGGGAGGVPVDCTQFDKLGTKFKTPNGWVTEAWEIHPGFANST
jgi:hypothetical protein